MASLDDLKKRIASVKSTQKITKAMKMVAAAKLRKAQESAEKGRPYSEKMNNVILNLSSGISDKENAPKLLAGTGQDKVHLCVVMTSDRGLCGGFNSNIIKKAKSYFSKILDENKIENKIVREPGGTKVGEGIRELLLSHDYKVDPLTEALLFCAQRSQLVNELIKPSIQNEIKILSDRSAYSSVAYQGVGRELGYEKIYQLNDIAIGGFWPEKVVLLDIDPLVSLDRQKVADRIGSDKIEFFQNIREGYLRLSEEFSDSFLVLDAEKNLEENLMKICNWLGIDKA